MERRRDRERRLGEGVERAEKEGDRERATGRETYSLIVKLIKLIIGR